MTKRRGRYLSQRRKVQSVLTLVQKKAEGLPGTVIGAGDEYYAPPGFALLDMHDSADQFSYPSALRLVRHTGSMYLGGGDIVTASFGRGSAGHITGFRKGSDGKDYPPQRIDDIYSPGGEFNVYVNSSAFTVKTDDAEYTDGVNTYKMSEINTATHMDQSGGTGDTYGALSGAVNGVNTDFTVSQGEYASGGLKVYLRGQLQTQGSSEDWIELNPSAGTFRFNTAPHTGDEITVEYHIVGKVAAPPAATHIETVTAGEAISQCDRVYLNPSDNEWYKVDSDATSSVKCGSLRGVANTAAAGNGSEFECVLWGPVANFSGLSAGSPLWASTTAGGYTQTKPDPTPGGGQLLIDRIGTAVSTTAIWVEPSRAIYVARETLANNGTMTIEHHSDDIPHTRNLRVYSLEAQLTGLDSSNQDAAGNLNPNLGVDKIAQSFQLSSAGDVRKARLYLKKSGTLTGKTITLRVETDSGGDPSGSLVDANATASMDADTIGASYAEYTFTFDGAFSLAGSTTYWLVLSCDYDGISGNIVWGSEGASGAGSYASGGAEYYDGAVWASLDIGANGQDDMCFRILTDRLDPCVIGRWGGGTRDIAARYDDGSDADENTETTIKNVTGAELEVMMMVEV